LFPQQLINGLTLGGIYALIALGYTLIFGVIRLINFAQGEMSMVGAFAALAVLGLLTPAPGPVPLLAAFACALVVAGLLGIAVERAAFRPVRMAPPLAALITSLGVSIFLQNVVMVSVGSDNKSFAAVFAPGHIGLGPARVTYLQGVILVLAVALMVGLDVLIKRTRFGRSVKATAENRELAMLVGISPKRATVLTFVLAAGLGSAAGVMYGLYYGVAKYDMGFLPGIKGFTAAILGGMGNIRGAMAGGVALGLMEALAAGYISADYKDVFAFGVLILVLVFRPQGFLGEKLSEE
jgi:branched-chain amino acid transport system permease protein